MIRITCLSVFASIKIHEAHEETRRSPLRVLRVLRGSNFYSWRCTLLILTLLIFLETACATVGVPAAPPVASRPPVTDLTLPLGYTADIVTDALHGPTQMILGPDGRLWMAQLAGGENEGAGQVIALDLETGEIEVLLERLRKPTGIAILENALWIASEHDLLRAKLDNDRPGTPQVVLRDLPYNGRSNGTLTPTPEGQLLYETSGLRQDNEAAPGSATLWLLDPADPTNPTPLATGLKNAYAHTVDDEGRLWITEIGDDGVNGQAPPEELNLVIPAADFGWPPCYGFQEAALNYAGTAAGCAQTRPPVVLFDPQTTPTSVVVSPWEEDALLVALWGAGTVMRVTVLPSGDNATGQTEPFITGLSNPQHLLPLPDNSLLLSDFGRNTLYRIYPPI